MHSLLLLSLKQYGVDLGPNTRPSVFPLSCSTSVSTLPLYRVYRWRASHLRNRDIVIALAVPSKMTRSHQCRHVCAPISRVIVHCYHSESKSDNIHDNGVPESMSIYSSYSLHSDTARSWTPPCLNSRQHTPTRMHRHTLRWPQVRNDIGKMKDPWEKT